MNRRSPLRYGWRTALALLLLAALHLVTGTGLVNAQTQDLTAFPPVATAGERSWVISPVPLRAGAALWVGGHETKLTPDRPAGWYAFEVPGDTTPGPQHLSLRGPGVGGGPVLTVIAPDAALDHYVAYVRPDLRDSIQQVYTARLERLQTLCRERCPAGLSRAVSQLSALKFSQLSPLGGRGPGVARAPARPAAPPLRSFALSAQGLRLTGLGDLLRAAPAADSGALGQGGLCSQLIGLLTAPPESYGLGLGLLNLLFAGEMNIDPTDTGHPTQALGDIPYRNKRPADVLDDLLGARSGTGRGVTVHVLDTADGPTDDFVTPTDTNYYNELYPSRPGHGSVVASIVHAVAPQAVVVTTGVCAGPSCSTRLVVEALCRVAQEAARGAQHVVNLSFGGPYPTLGVGLALIDVAGHGVPTAASYGNREDCRAARPGDTCTHYPADWTATFAAGPGLPTLLLSVAGWDIGSREYATYNRTAVIPWGLSALPSVQAPGEFWFAGQPYFGTSFAAPVVAGVLADWMSCRPGIPFMPLLTTPGVNPLVPGVLNACP